MSRKREGETPIVELTTGRLHLLRGGDKGESSFKRVAHTAPTIYSVGCSVSQPGDWVAQVSVELQLDAGRREVGQEVLNLLQKIATRGLKRHESTGCQQPLLHT